MKPRSLSKAKLLSMLHIAQFERDEWKARLDQLDGLMGVMVESDELKEKLGHSCGATEDSGCNCNCGYSKF